MPTWKLLIIWEVILCELNVNGRDLSGQAVKFPTAGKKCGWLLTGLSSCRNLHSRKLLLASVRHPEQNFLSHLSGSVKPLLSFQSLSRERSAFTRVPGILTPDYPQVRFFRGKSIVGYSEEIGESHILISGATLRKKQSVNPPRSEGNSPQIPQPYSHLLPPK